MWPGSSQAASGGPCAVAGAAPATDRQALRTRAERGFDALAVTPSHARALDEMLFAGHASVLRWDRAPELVVVMSVLKYETDRSIDYRATAEQLTDAEATALVADLTDALAVLTSDAFRSFAAVRRETLPAGERVTTIRPGQIVVGRYDGVREQLATLGFGVRSTRGDSIRAGSIILDSDFDRTSDDRRLLRMHELGHALGYNHVQSQASIMNPRIGPGVTDFDRAAVRLAFQDFPRASGSCSARE